MGRMSSVFGIPSLNPVDRAKFLSLPAHNIHNLVPVSTEMPCSPQGKSHLLLKTFFLSSVFH